jgi:hypothetical protein
VDPTREQLGRKLGKHYKTAVPVELAAYFFSEPDGTGGWLADVQRFVAPRRSPFRRVWIFDLWSWSILFVKPPPCGGTT